MTHKPTRKVLVTGGAGFIGSHVAAALAERGYRVHVLDDLSSGLRANVPEPAVLHEMDVRDPAVVDLFRSERFEILVHHAAQMDVRRSVADPVFDADVNLRGLLNLMEAGRASGLKKVIFASTGGAIYGEPAYVPQDEEHPLRPLSPYGVTKLASEKYLYYYKHVHDIPFVALRYGNVYGPRQNPHGEAGVVAIFCNLLLDGGQPVIHGDGEQTRDYVFVSDVVRANLAALDSKHTGVFNVGTGLETSVNRLFSRLRDELAPAVREEHGAAKAGEQRRSVLSFERARNLLGWQPVINVKDGLRMTAAWFRDQRGADRS
jgi:UDP-glucose 4-epimerase